MSRDFVRHDGYLVQPLPDSTPDGLAGFHFVVKRSFDLEPGQVLRPRGLQRPLFMADVYAEPSEPSRSALLHASDLCPPKAACDVILVGHCHPADGAVATCKVRLRFGDTLDKTVLIVGDRAVWQRPGEQSARVSKPKPFEAMPLSWPRAYGGTPLYEGHPVPHPANPAGVGLWLTPGPDAEAPERWGALPNLEHPNAPLQMNALVIGAGALDEAAAPAAFGWIPAHWAPRKHRAGQDPRFESVYRRVTAGVPEGVPKTPFKVRDSKYYNAAPDDQIVPYPSGGEQVIIENVHPEHSRLEFSIPSTAPKLEWSEGGAWKAVTLQLDTVVIDTDRLCVELVWRGTSPSETRNLLDVESIGLKVDGDYTPPAALVDRGFPLVLLYPDAFEP